MNHRTANLVRETDKNERDDFDGIVKDCRWIDEPDDSIVGLISFLTDSGRERLGFVANNGQDSIVQRETQERGPINLKNQKGTELVGREVS